MAAQNIQSGQVICQYAGESIKSKEADERLRVYDRDSVGHALLVCFSALLCLVIPVFQEFFNALTKLAFKAVQHIGHYLSCAGCETALAFTATCTAIQHRCNKAGKCCKIHQSQMWGSQHNACDSVEIWFTPPCCCCSCPCQHQDG